MQVVAGLSLSNMNPRVWLPDSPYYLPDLQAVMISYAGIHRTPQRRKNAMEIGVRQLLDIPKNVQIYLDNGAFSFLNRQEDGPVQEYEAFVAKAGLDWYPIPQDFIPTPQMSRAEQELCYQRTMQVNHDYSHDGFTPVVHVSPFLENYTQSILANELLAAKQNFALGGIVPNLLRSKKAVPYQEVIDSLRHTREAFKGKNLHVFGIGGTATLHLAALLEMDSADSSGWRNRAARGIVQLPGRGDRIVADLGKWRGREPDEREWKTIEDCQCPACRQFGLEGIKSSGSHGFCNRATHNLWILLKEVEWIDARIADGTYAEAYREHLQNSTYRRLVDAVVKIRFGTE